MATPALIRIEDKLQLIHYAGGIMGCDPKTGDILWTCRAPSAQSSPVFGDGLLYADDGRGGQKGAAIDPTGKGDVSKTHVNWEARVEGAAGSSAIFVDEHIYRSSGRNFIRCWSMKTGELVHEIAAPRITPQRQPHRHAGRPHLLRQPRPELRHQGDAEARGAGDQRPRRRRRLHDAAVSNGPHLHQGELASVVHRQEVKAEKFWASRDSIATHSSKTSCGLDAPRDARIV